MSASPRWRVIICFQKMMKIELINIQSQFLIFEILYNLVNSINYARASYPRCIFQNENRYGRGCPTFATFHVKTRKVVRLLIFIILIQFVYWMK